MAEKKIQAAIIVEIAGRPADYVKQSLETHVLNLNNFEDLEVVSKKISEPKQLQNQDAFTCFAEIEFKVPTFQKLLDVIFDFMPSSVEIIEPGKIEMDSQEATMFTNNLTGRLHRYDDIAKMAQFRIRQLTEELNHYKQEIQKLKSIPKEKDTKLTDKKPKKDSKEKTKKKTKT